MAKQLKQYARISGINVGDAGGARGHSGAEIGAQSTRRIGSVFKAEAVALWNAREARMDKGGPGVIVYDDVHAVYVHEIFRN